MTCVSRNARACVCRFSCAVVLLCLWGTAAQAEIVDRQKFTTEEVYQLHVSNAAFRFCDANRDGAFQPSELPCYDQFRASQPLAAPGSQAPARYVKTTPNLAATLFEAELDAEPYREQRCRPHKGLLVRRSKPDIGNLADPICVGEAVGAEFSWASNRLSDKDVWQAHGLVALPVNFASTLEQQVPYLETITLSPYLSFDRVSNDDNIKTRIDDLGYGGLLEIAVPNVLGATQNFDIDAGLLSNFSGNLKNWAFNVTWEPQGTEEGSLFGAFGPQMYRGRYFTAGLMPTLQTGIENELGDLAGQPIFAENDWVLRTGPTVTFAIDGAKNRFVPTFVQNLHYEITYGWLYDWLSGRDYGLLDTALSFTLDRDGHLGLTLSYRNGQLESTGQDVDLANVGLSLSY